MDKKLVWSREKPKEPGWYWRKVYPDTVPDVVEIGIFNGKVEWWSYFNACWRRRLGKSWEWAGPIPEPEESEGGERHETADNTES